MKSNDYKEYNLSHRADSIVLEKLEYSKTLSKLIKSNKRLDKAKKITYLPQDIDIDILDDYEGSMGISIGPAREWMAQKVSTFLDKNENNVVIIQNPCARPNDPWIQKEDYNNYMCFFNDETYFTLYSEHANNPEIVNKILYLAGSPYDLLGLMTSLPESSEVLPKELTLKILEELVANLSSFFVYAFDDESFILCFTNSHNSAG